tara:strand:- start:4209 stop:4469 length:261 start_codon:yes stop_codon:yes gene_type:complete
MNDYNPNDFVNPTQVRSPYSGETSRPTISQYDQGGNTYEQAIFTDPVTGHIIKKGITSIKSKETGETIVDWQTVHAAASNTTQSRS